MNIFELLNNIRKNKNIQINVSGDKFITQFGEYFFGFLNYYEQQYYFKMFVYCFGNFNKYKFIFLNNFIEYKHISEEIRIEDEKDIEKILNYLKKEYNKGAIMEKVKIYCLEKHYEPKRANKDDAGLDLFARIETSHYIKDFNNIQNIIIDEDEVLKLYPKQRVTIPLGIKTEIPVGYYADLRPRSGNSLKLGLLFVNSVGLIDAGYRDEWCAIIQNISNEVVEIKNGMKIAQVVFKKLEDINYNIDIVESEAELYGLNNRGGGFGSSDKKE